jgi:hypothetical protein
MGSDDRKAKREMKLTNWSRLSAETLKYALRNLMPHHSSLRWLSDLVKAVAKRRELNSEIFSLKCARGAQIARQIGFSDANLGRDLQHG